MKLFKKVLLAIFAVTFSLGIAAFAASCDKEPENVTYTVSVTCEDPSIFDSLKVRLIKDGNTVAEESIKAGKATFTLAPDDYTVELAGLSSGYTYSKGSLSKSKLSETIAIKTTEPSVTAKITYRVSVTCEEESALTGVQIVLKRGGAEIARAQLSGASAEFELEEGDYTVELEGLSEGFTYQKGTLSKSVREISIRVEKAANTLVYSVRVTCEDEEGLEGVEVVIKKNNTEVARKALKDGAAAFKLAEGSYTASLDGLEEGYSYQPATFDSSRTATIAVTKEQTDPQEAEYTIALTSSEELSFEEVKVTFKKDGKEVVSGTCDQDGRCTLKALPDDYTVELSNLPEGCTYPETSTGTQTSISIEITFSAQASEEAREAFLGTWTGQNNENETLELVVTEEEVSFSVKGSKWDVEFEFSEDDTSKKITFKYGENSYRLVLNEDGNSIDVYQGSEKYGSMTKEPTLLEKVQGEWVSGAKELSISEDKVTLKDGKNTKSYTIVSYTGGGVFTLKDEDGKSASFSFKDEKITFDGADYTRPQQKAALPKDAHGVWVGVDSKQKDAGTLRIDEKSIVWDTSGNIVCTGTVVSYQETAEGTGSGVIEFSNSAKFNFTYQYSDKNNEKLLFNPTEDSTDENSYTFTRPKQDTLPETLKGSYTCEGKGTLTINSKDDITLKTLGSSQKTYKGKVEGFDNTSGKLILDLAESSNHSIFTFVYDSTKDTLTLSGDVYKKAGTTPVEPDEPDKPDKPVEPDPDVTPIDPKDLPKSLTGSYYYNQEGITYTFDGFNVTKDQMNFSGGGNIVHKGFITEYEDSGDLTIYYSDSDDYEYLVYYEDSDEIYDEDKDLTFVKQKPLVVPTLEGTWKSEDGTLVLVFKDGKVTVTDSSKEGETVTYTADISSTDIKETTMDVVWTNPNDNLLWHLNYLASTGKASVAPVLRQPNGPADTTIDNMTVTVEKVEDEKDKG